MPGPHGPRRPPAAPAATPGLGRPDAARRTRRPSGRAAWRRVGWRLAAALGLAVGLAVAQTASAHDLWIEPTTFSPEPGQVVGAKLRVGVDLVGEPLPRFAALIDTFVAVDAAGRQPLYGRERADPAGLLRARTPGLVVLGYHSRPSRVELPADKFDAYLREEGLDAVLALRNGGGDGDARHTGTREQFFRCAKSLLRVGPPDEAEGEGDRVLGFPLELVAERNPYVPGAPDDLPVRLIYEGRPLAGALVVAIRRTGDAVERLALRSDGDGRVRLRLPPGSGLWLIKAVHMVPAAADAAAEADWSSYWASLTFASRASSMASP